MAVPALTASELANRIYTVFSRVLSEEGLGKEQAVGAATLLSHFLSSLGLKSSSETIKQSIDRLQAKPTKFDLLDDDHRQFIANVLYQMFEPLGVN